MNLGDVRDEVGVAALDEVEVAEPWVGLQELVAVALAVVTEFHRVIPEPRRHEAQLRAQAERRPVDVGGNEDAAHPVHFLLQFQHGQVEGVDEKVRNLVDYILVLVHHQLVAELVHVVLEEDYPGIQEGLEFRQLLGGGHEGQAVDLFLGGDLRAHEHVKAHLFPKPAGDVGVEGGIVIGEADYVHPAGLCRFHYGRGAHLDVSAGGEHRVDVHIGLELHYLRSS